MRAVFMGTPEIAAVILKDLLQSKHEIVAVVTQPDKPKGRSQAKLAFPPVKEVALEHNIPVLQPQKIKEESFLEEHLPGYSDYEKKVKYRLIPYLW